MTQLQQSPDIILAARSLGVELDPSITFDPQTPLLKMAAQVNGSSAEFGAEDCDFGYSNFGFFGPFKKLKKKVVVKMAAKVKTPTAKAAVLKLAKAPVKVDIKKTATGLAKGIGTGVAVASFVVPGVGPLIGAGALGALAAADKVLGDPRVKDAAKIISNTKALAALGNVPARRGAAALAAVAQIRQVKKTPPGKAAVPAKMPVITANYTQKTPAPQVKALAIKAVAAAPRRSFWQKLKDLFT